MAATINNSNSSNYNNNKISILIIYPTHNIKINNSNSSNSSKFNTQILRESSNLISNTLLGVGQWQVHKVCRILEKIILLALL